MAFDSASHDEPLLSTYANDAAVADILPLFIANLPKYLENLAKHCEAGDWTQAGRVCHDLKGTSGGYGYPDLGGVARQIEVELKGARDMTVLLPLLAQARVLCHRASIALPGHGQ